MSAVTTASRAVRVSALGDVRVSRADTVGFVVRLILAAVLTAGGIWLLTTGSVIGTLAGILVLAAMFTHAVELQHQCLHHSGFRHAGLHRPIGILLGVPMLVSYSHYRVRHLQHHRYLGTERDSEFFGFDARERITVTALLRGLFDYMRLLTVLRCIGQSFRGSWHYSDGQISAKVRRHVMHEYILLGTCLLGAVTLAAVGFGYEVLVMWLLPLVVAVPIHFLVELPEHVLCDHDTTDVRLNTRSIVGSWLSTWYTNSNNLHIEHHLSMRIPMQRLVKESQEAQAKAAHVSRSYYEFYRVVLSALRRGRRSPGTQSASDFYHEGARAMQNALGTRELADHIADKYVTSQLGESATAMIRAADCFYLATADRQGQPDCSYKGGLPGFVTVLSDTELAFPSYDGNGMFRSLGNILVNPAVGMLFVSYAEPGRLRVNGTARVSHDAPDVAEYPGANAVIYVTIRQVFDNCPRYLHDQASGTHSVHCPRPGYEPPDPAWKLKPEYDHILRR